jgi:hypothetical protein
VKKNLYCSKYFYLNNKKNYLCNIKSLKNGNVLRWIVIEKCEEKKNKNNA